MDLDAIATLRQWVAQAHAIVFFGGAGVSTESGVPDFRSKDGLYNQRDVRFERYRPEYLLSHTCLVREPEVFFTFYRQKMDTRAIQPNAAHRVLAAWEGQGKLSAVVTQNIDGLHQKAGSKAVYEIHGSTARNYCMQCGKRYDENYLFDSPDPVPRCTCGGVVRCDVTLYEEPLPERAVAGALHAIEQADLLIIGGTSLTVYPAASFVNVYRGDRRVILNKEPLALSRGAHTDLAIHAPIGQVLAQL